MRIIVVNCLLFSIFETLETSLINEQESKNSCELLTF